MPDGEKFSISKFFGSFFEVVPWMKNIRFIVGLVLVLFVGYTVYRAYIMPRNKQTQNTQIHVAPGGTLNLNQSQKIEEKKRAWWMPTPFAEGYGFYESDGRNGVGVRAGARFEF